MKLTPSTLAVALCAAGVLAAAPAQAQTVKPLKALLLTGGCCHDYKNQKRILPEGISARANVEWTVIQDPNNGTRGSGVLYTNENWAAGYDVIIHNECYADDTDPAYIEKALKPHRDGVPALVFHCQMHTFRGLKTDAYREFLGLSSFGHGPQQPLDVKVLNPNHPVMQGFPDGWKTGNEELYVSAKVWPTATALAQAYAVDKKTDMVMIWVNQYAKARVFGTTLAHANKTMEDPVFLDLVTRGLLWSCGKLDDQGKPLPGYGKKP